MANIRQKFTASSNLNGYQKKKYCWKLVYMFMLGYDIDFGHMEVINLISSLKFSEKNTGYMATTILLKSTDDLMTLVINSIRNDLVSSISWAQTLALSAIANIGGSELAETLSADVQRLLVAHNTSPAARKKAALCLLRLFRQCPHIMVPSEWAPRVIGLLEDRHLGVVTSVVSLILGLVSEDTGSFAEVVPAAITLLSRLVMHKACSEDYLYHDRPSPWLQVKLLKLLQYFPAPEDPTQSGRLNESIWKILFEIKVTSSVYKNNADHSILFEAMKLLIHYGAFADPGLTKQMRTLLGRFIKVRQPNIRYLALELDRLTHVPLSVPVAEDSAAEQWGGAAAAASSSGCSGSASAVAGSIFNASMASMAIGRPAAKDGGDGDAAAVTVAAAATATATGAAGAAQDGASGGGSSSSSSDDDES